MIVPAFAAALSGAFCFAVAAVLQQRQAALAPVRDHGRPALIRYLVRRPLWLVGMVAAAAGVGLHVTALSWGPLVEVQPVGVVTPVFAVLLRASFGGGRPRVPALGGSIVVCVGLGCLLAALRPQPGLPIATGPTLVGLAVVGSVVVALLTVAAPMLSGSLRTLVQAGAAGVCTGLVSAAIRMVVPDMAATGVLLLIGTALLIVAFAVAGQVLLQTAYASGRLALTLATLTVIDPLTAAGTGVAWFGERAEVSDLRLASVGALLIIAGMTVLAAPASGQPLESPAELLSDEQQPGHAPSAPLRVLIGTDTYPPHLDGAAVFTRRLAHALAARGHEVHVICAARQRVSRSSALGLRRPAETLLEGRVTLHRLQSLAVPFRSELSFCPPWRVRARIASVARAIRPDVVHIQTHYLIGRALSRWAPDAGVALVATNHFMPLNLLMQVPVPARLGGWVGRWCWRDCWRVLDRADSVTAPTPLAAQALIDNGFRGPVTAVSGGIDLKRFHPGAISRAGAISGADAFGASGRHPSVLFVGRLDPDKRLVDLIDAFALVDQAVDARLLIAGTGSQRQRLQARVAGRGVGHRTEFLGFVPDEDLAGLYASADVFCMPGIAELQSLATLEAMACALPVIAADALALPHLVRHGHNGFRYPPGDVAAFAESLTVLLTDPERARSMGAASRALAESHDLEYSVDRFECIYRTACQREPIRR